MTFKDYERIVEYSYQSKTKKFVIRFLDGTSYILQVDDLPKRLRTKKPDWDNTALASDSSKIVFIAGGEEREIPAHIIHARGTLAQ